jgi:hypothetical protein
MRCRTVPSTGPRRFIGDLMHFSAGVPTVPVQRRMHLAEVAAARSAAAGRPSWPALFVKAYARVAADTPALRRAYVKLPWPRVVEYPTSVASVAVERDYRGEPAVFFGKVSDPAGRPAADISALIRGFAADPLDRVASHRKLLALARLPRPVRRAGMWLGLNLARTRPGQFGTFGVTVYSSLGAESLHPLSPQTTTLTYGVVGADGAVDVRLVYDHRVLDGATVARALARLEAELTGAVLAELRGTAGGPVRLAA